MSPQILNRAAFNTLKSDLKRRNTRVTSAFIWKTPHTDY